MKLLVIKSIAKSSKNKKGLAEKYLKKLAPEKKTKF